jgi:chromosome segregation ATPase
MMKRDRQSSPVLPPAMSVALKLYEQLTETADERQRFRLIADAIGRLEDSWPRPSDVARTSDVRESELRLQKEIEGVRKEIESLRKDTESLRNETVSLRKDTESLRKETVSLRKEIEAIRRDIEEIRREIEAIRKESMESESRLRKEIEQVRTETEQVRRETAQVRLEVERVRGEIGAVEIRLHQALHRQTVWIIGAVGAVVGLIRLLDYLVQ